MAVQFTNERCEWFVSVENVTTGACGAPVWILPNGRRVNTPYCEEHARQWSELRARDIESSMGG